MATPLWICFTLAGCLCFTISQSFKFPSVIEDLRRNVNRTPKLPTCDYESCNIGKKEYLNIHLVPHTHDDVGWLKTVDQYFYGARNDIQRAGVQYILDSVIAQLKDDSRKRFIYVEMAFFYRWWLQQHDLIRHSVKNLVNQGRLEFILGGWSMNDEASTHYSAIIDQHTLGLKFLNDNFGKCGRPKVAWQIDPFGHSKEQASLFAQMGYDGLFFARIDYQDRVMRKDKKTMEMIWQASNSIKGGAAELFTGVMYDHYGPPATFCFDMLCNDQPIMDDKRLHDFNVDERVATFIKYVNKVASSSLTNHIMLTMGSDFNYQNADTWFSNMDKLIQYVNAKKANGSKVNVFYSTPSCYLYASNKASVTSWPTKSDDFFPYASNAHQFWTGYFTSRPALKGYVRQTSNILQVCKQLDTLAQLDSTHGSSLKIFALSEAMGIAQHHDAVSGTEKQHVADDYALRLSKGVKECEDVIDDAIGQILSKNKILHPFPTQTFCQLINISLCSVSGQAKQFVMTAYNPLPRPTTSWLDIPVFGKYYTITSPDNRLIMYTIVPVSKRTKEIPERMSTATSRYTLMMKVILPPLGLSSFMISMRNNIERQLKQPYSRQIIQRGVPYILQNQFIKITFDANSGMISKMSNIVENIDLKMHQSLRYYTGFLGNNSKPAFQSSGAYIFRPHETTPRLFASTVRNTLVKAGVVQEMHQEFSPWATQVVRLRSQEMFAEIEWTIGPIPIKDGVGKEVVNYFESEMKTNSLFYTDANGRETQTRRRNYRPTWQLIQTESAAGNYYPVNAFTFIKDETSNVQLSVLTDRSQGGASIKDGYIELMVHRRLLHDDSFGVGEALNETGSDKKGLIVRGKHYITLDRIEKSSRLVREMAKNLFMKTTLSFAETRLTMSQWKDRYLTTWSGMKNMLPSNVHLLSLEQWYGKDIMIRLEHFYEENEDPILSKPAVVSLQELFTPFEIISVEELMLAANMKKADSKRLLWKHTGDGQPDNNFETSDSNENLEVTLTPMQIRTFQVTLA